MVPVREVSVMSSRERVLAVVRRGTEPVRADVIRDETGLSANAVRFHLQNLVEQGAVRSMRDPDHAGPGRPAILYRAAPREAVDGASAYRMLAGLLARELARCGPADAPTRAGMAWARRRPAHQAVETANGQRAIDVAVALFEDTGFAPAPGPEPNTIELHRCPFIELAIELPDVVCRAHLGMLAGVLDGAGNHTKVRMVPALSGSQPCLVHITPT
jgi:predicted ArsR family transcriptional regulator